ncbi:MAG: hypothetical protein N2487_02695 [Verrucomicrobiae bacterium]|nr:hypothetical protein [Verrucomicrobiae bacterium]
MKVEQWRLVVAGILLFYATVLVYAVSEQDRYGAIIRRNAFNLREPEPPKPPPEPPPSVKVNLTGITTLLSNKRVFLLIQEQGKQPESKMLGEGDRDGQIEVLTINEGEGSVKVKIGDKESVLTFEKDGIKPPTSPVGAPGVPAVPGGVPPVPSLPGAALPGAPTTTGIAPSSPTVFGGQSVSSGSVASVGEGSLPTRQIRSETTGGGQTSISGLSGVPTANSAVTVATSSGQGVTLKMGGSSTQSKVQPNWPPENPPSTWEEAVILHEALRIKHQKEIESGAMPPLPGEPIR